MTQAPEPVRRSHRVRGVAPREVYDVVVDFASYPRLFRELTAARVIERERRGEGERVRVEFRAQVVLTVRYVLDLVCDPTALTVDWTYVEGEVVTSSIGGWTFTAEGPDTVVGYRAAIEIRAPLPAFLVRKATDGLVAASLPAMFSALEREVAARRSAGAAR